MAKKRAANEAAKMAQKRVELSYRKKEAMTRAKKRLNAAYKDEENKRKKRGTRPQ